VGAVVAQHETDLTAGRAFMPTGALGLPERGDWAEGRHWRSAATKLSRSLVVWPRRGAWSSISAGSAAGVKT